MTTKKSRLVEFPNYILLWVSTKFLVQVGLRSLRFRETLNSRRKKCQCDFMSLRRGGTLRTVKKETAKNLRKEKCQNFIRKSSKFSKNSKPCHLFHHFVLSLLQLPKVFLKITQRAIFISENWFAKFSSSFQFSFAFEIITTTFKQSIFNLTSSCYTEHVTVLHLVSP